MTESNLRKKRKGILLSFPIIIILLLEFILKLSGYTGKDRLIQTGELNGAEIYTLNPNVGGRYFSQKDIKPAIRTNQFFPKQKASYAYRIVVLGGSTVYGFPYPPNVTFPHFLEKRLSNLIPSRKIEIINAGLPALNSFAVREFVSELTQYQPNLFLIYLGHDEFYGALGLGSSEAVSSNPKFTNLHLSLQKFAIYRLLQDIVRWSKDKMEDENDGSSNLLERLATKRKILLAGDEYDSTIRNLRENLAKIIDVAHKNNIKVLVSGVVENQRGWKPFGSAFSSNLNDEDKKSWEELISESKDLRKNGKYEEALKKLDTAKTIDASTADLYYETALTFEKIGEFGKAKQAYAQAIDLDALRIRAPSEFNKTIKEVCQEKEAIYVDMEAFFEKNSTNEIIGNELISDHVHPNLFGYFLMAKIFARALYVSKAVPESLWQWERDLSEEAYLQLAHVTELDTTIGALRKKFFVRQWPFRKYKVMFSPGIKTPIQKLAYQVIQNQLSWQQAHFKLAHVYKEQGRYRKAQAEYLAVFNAAPSDVAPLIFAADCSFSEGDFIKADSLYNLASKMFPDSPFAYAKLGLLSYAQKNYYKAITYFQTSLEENNSKDLFTEKDKTEAVFYLSDSYYQIGDSSSALKYASQLKTNKSNDRKIARFLEKLNLN